MKNLSFKISLIIFSYFILFVLIIMSYITIVPEESLEVLENNSPLVKKVENKFGTKKDTVYKILEKPKKIEDIIEREFKEVKEKENTDYNALKIYRIQLASFRDKEKSNQTSQRILKNNFFKDNNIDLDIKKINLKNNETFYRVVSRSSFSLDKANSHCKILKKKKLIA